MKWKRNFRLNETRPKCQSKTSLCQIKSEEISLICFFLFQLRSFYRPSNDPFRKVDYIFLNLELKFKGMTFFVSNNVFLKEKIERSLFRNLFFKCLLESIRRKNLKNPLHFNFTLIFIDVIWFHFISHAFQFDFIWSHLISIWFHLISLWFHLVSLLSKGKMELLSKGKRERLQGRKGKGKVTRHYFGPRSD